MTFVRSLAAETWRREVYRRINSRMRLKGEEFREEMDRLRSLVDGLRNLSKHLLAEKHD